MLKPKDFSLFFSFNLGIIYPILTVQHGKHLKLSELPWKNHKELFFLIYGWEINKGTERLKKWPWAIPQVSLLIQVGSSPTNLRHCIRNVNQVQKNANEYSNPLCCTITSFTLVLLLASQPSSLFCLVSYLTASWSLCQGRLCWKRHYYLSLCCQSNSSLHKDAAEELACVQKIVLLVLYRLLGPHLLPLACVRKREGSSLSSF